MAPLPLVIESSHHVGFEPESNAITTDHSSFRPYQTRVFTGLYGAKLAHGILAGSPGTFLLYKTGKQA